MAANPSGEVLFDTPLELPTPLRDLWEEADPYSPDPFHAKLRLRLHRAAGLIVRSHHRLDYKTQYSVDEEPLPMDARLGLVEAHFAILQQAGLSIIRHRTELASHGDNVAYSASAFVPHAVPLNKPRAAEQIPRDKVEALVVTPLQRYYEWCRETGANLILSDIYDPHQFSWDLASRAVYLHDIDPRLTEHSPGNPAGDPEGLLVIEEIAESFQDIGQ